MGQSLVKNYVHIVFSTKHRLPLIDNRIETDLHRYLGGICNRLECHVIKVGGYVDHVHILCMLSKNISLAKLLETLKAHSSKWMKEHENGCNYFYWQNGYCAFSVKPIEIDATIEYIANQHIHHCNKPFQDEYRKLLNQNRVEYDERYVWD